MERPQCKWDSVIPFEPMWEQLKRIAKKKAAICLFGSQPFTSTLVGSNLTGFKYEWVWDKKRPSNPMLAKVQALKVHESICVFNGGNYYPQDLIKTDKPRGGTAPSKTALGFGKNLTEPYNAGVL
jgi:site-specific DNA-methyltransferase (adenine-specific)